MKFFIDTANLEEIQEAQDLCILDGVTTNPSLMAKEGKTGDINQVYLHYEKICKLVDGDVSAEVISTDFDGMIKEAKLLSSIDAKIVIKIPMIIDGIKVIKYLSNKGIRTNCTLVFSLGQALIAAKAGATYVSPFLGRLDDISSDSLKFIKDMRLIFDNYHYKTSILSASIRNPMHIINCAKIGVDVITSPLESIKSLLQHPLTDIGLVRFLEDYTKNT